MPKVGGLAETLDAESKHRLIKAMEHRKPRTEPLWKGPYEDGISQSMICRFLVCRERFRIAYIEGLEPFPSLNKAIHYGNMWHICEEFHALKKDWSEPLRKYSAKLQREFPLQQQDVLLLEMICRMQFPIYLDFWKLHGPKLGRTAVLSEDVFCEEYPLPDKKRTVILRGKFDRVDQDTFGKFWLRENKTKTEIDEFKIGRQLKFDLQTMMYLSALLLRREARKSPFEKKKLKLGGVQYNVVRRPLSGGKYSIRRLMPNKKNKVEEPLDTYINNRLAKLVKAHSDEFFGRWDVEINETDIIRFQHEFLNPILTQICDWWDALVSGNPMKPWWGPETNMFNPYHYRTPYGLYNAMLESGMTDLDDYIETGNLVGLTKVPRLFRELQPEEGL